MATARKSKPKAGNGKPARVSERERRRKRVEMALANPVFFGELYVRPYDPGWRDAPPLPHHAGELLYWLGRTRRGVVITPPEFLKSTVGSQLYPLWLTCRYAAAGRLGELTGMLLSEEQKLAERNLSVVAWHIENNERVARDFIDTQGRTLLVPDADEDKWTDSEIVVARTGKTKDPTWQAKGLDSKGIQGARLRHLIGDDVITPRSAGSPAVQERALNLWDTQVTTRVVEDGQAVVMGNYNAPRDLVSVLATRRSYKVLRRPSLHMPGDPSTAPEDPTDPDAIPTFPTKWSRERLDAERAEKPNRFRRIHLLDSRAEQGERLKVSWVQVIDPDTTPLGDTRWVIGIDPAPGGESDNLDFFNLTVGALHGTGHDQHLDIAISHDLRTTPGDQVELVGAYYDRFSRIGHGVTAIGVSKVSLDRYFAGAVTIGRPDLRPKLVPISIPGSKTERLEQLGPYCKSGWCRIWEAAWTQLTSSAADQPEELSLFEQWRDFPSVPHDDKLDGLDVVIRTAREFGGRGAVKTVRLTAQS